MAKKKQEPPELPRDAAGLTFQRINLVRGGCHLGSLNADRLPFRAKQSFSLEAFHDADAGVLTVAADFRLTLDYDKPEEANPAVTLGATFMLQYRCLLKPEKPPCESDERIIMMDAWPYWREFAQSMTVRMGLPAIQVATSSEAELQTVETFPSE